MRKNTMMALLAASLFTASVPAMAMEHGMAGQQHDEQCQKECEMLMKDCRVEVDSIQEKIAKLQHAITNNADKYSEQELSRLKDKLESAKKMLVDLNRAGA